MVQRVCNYSALLVVGMAIGGGLYIPFTGKLSMMSLDVGGRYFTGGEATYLTEGAIQDNPDGSITLFPSHSKTDQVTWHVGVSYTIPNR